MAASQHQLLGFGFGAGGSNPSVIETASSISARYWSINFTAHAGWTETTVSEMEWGLLGGADNVASTATATSTAGGNVATNVFDNNQGTHWIASSSANPQRISVDFGSAIDVNVVRLKSLLTSWTATVDSSPDGSSWTTRWNCNATNNIFTDPNFWSYPNPTCTTGGKHIWRLAVTASDNGTRTHISEIELRDAVGGTDKTVSTNNLWNDGHFSTDAPVNAFDNNNATDYTAVANNGGTLYYEFEGSFDVKELAIRASTAQPLAAPKDFTLAYSANGITFTTALTVTGSTAWSSGETRLFTIP